MQLQAQSPHRKARNTFRAHVPQVLALLFLQILTRLAAFAPLLYAAAGGGFGGLLPGHEPALGLMLSLVLYVFLVMPMRFQAAARMAALHGAPRLYRLTGTSYARWLAAALYRLARALPLLLPFLLFLGAFYYYLRVPPFNESLVAIEGLGKTLGGDTVTGIALVVLAGLVTLLLFVCGWTKGVAFEHQPVLETGVSASWRAAKELKKRRRRRIARTVFINALLTLPALLGILAMLALYFYPQRSGMLIFDFFNVGTALLILSFPASVVLQGVAALAVLYLPLLPLRKLALSAVLAPGASAAQDGHAAG